jgi:hypothetical protein
MYFQVNRHFDQCAVNTSYSSVLLPEALAKDPGKQDFEGKHRILGVLHFLITPKNKSLR